MDTPSFSLIVTGSFDGARGDKNISLTECHGGFGDYDRETYTHFTYVPWTDGLQCTLVSNVPVDNLDELQKLKELLEAGESGPGWKMITDDILGNLQGLKAKGALRRYHIVVHTKPSLFKANAQTQAQTP